MGWLPDYGGAIRFDGKDAKDFTPEQLQRQMSYIEQNVFLFNSTIWDNITLVGHQPTPKRKGQFTKVYDLQPVTLHLQSA